MSAFRKRNIILTNLPWLMKTHGDNYQWKGRPLLGLEGGGRRKKKEEKEGRRSKKGERV